MMKIVNYWHKHKSHVDSFITGVVADFLIEGAPYFAYLVNINDEQILDVSFWGMVGSGIMYTIVRSFIKQGGQTVIIELKNFVKSSKK